MIGMLSMVVIGVGTMFHDVKTSIECLAGVVVFLGSLVADRYPQTAPVTATDLTDRPFGRLRVVALRHRDAEKRAGVAPTPSLRKAHSRSRQRAQSEILRSCGCLRYQRAAAATEKDCTTHGFAPKYEKRPPEYKAWGGYVQRCTNPKCHSYDDYGGRGIIVCRRWLANSRISMPDMGPRPSKHDARSRRQRRTLSPTNCRWATAREQARKQAEQTVA